MKSCFAGCFTGGIGPALAAAAPSGLVTLPSRRSSSGDMDTVMSGVCSPAGVENSSIISAGLATCTWTVCAGL